jgi:hypothetical protein
MVMILVPISKLHLRAVVHGRDRMVVGFTTTCAISGSEFIYHSYCLFIYLFNSSQTQFRVMIVVYNAILNTISVILWRSVLLVEETGIPGENHRPAISH